MSRRTIVSLTASVIIGIACIVTVSTDAFAYRRGVGVGRAGVYHGGVYRVASIVVQPCAVELPWASELLRLVLLLTGLTEPTEAIAAAATNLTPLATSRSWRSGHRVTG